MSPEPPITIPNAFGSPPPQRPVLKIWIISVVLVIIIAAGGWVGYRSIANNNKNTNSMTNGGDQTNTNSTSTQSSVGTVFGQEIDEQAYLATLAMFSSMSQLDLFSISNQLGFEGDQTPQTVALYVHSLPLVIKEALSRMGTPSTKTQEQLIQFLKESITADQKQDILDKISLDDKYWDTFLDMTARLSRQDEFESMVNKKHQKAFDDLLSPIITSIHDAFVQKLRHSTTDELDALRNYTSDSPVQTRINELLPLADDSYIAQSDTADNAAISSLQLPSTLLSFLQSHQTQPNQVSEVMRDGDYWYMGMVLNPAKYPDLSPGFTRDDVLVARFPSYELMYESIILTLLWNEGLQSHNIQYKDYDGSLLNPIDVDHDGLLMYVETTLGTSDTVADTDRDGYTDLTEYQNGFNPNGT